MPSRSRRAHGRPVHARLYDLGVVRRVSWLHRPATIGHMLEPLPARIYKARRAAIEARLTGAGLPRDDAERWLVA
jgi:hypothetical protein